MGLAERTECTTQVEARKLRHAQVKEDGVGLVFQSQTQCMLGIIRVNDFVIIGQVQTEEESLAHQIRVKAPQWYHPRGLRAIIGNAIAKGSATGPN